jgi:hypothetical protein
VSSELAVNPDFTNSVSRRALRPEIRSRIVIASR